jgi:transcriptional regulator with XRE-family HTH domain
MRNETIVDRSWLERARRKLGLRQSEVAAYAGCDVSFYNRVEKGLQTPGVVIALKICDCLGVDIRNFEQEEKLA